MMFTALEIWINGIHKFTAGANDWRTIHATIFGHNINIDEMGVQGLGGPSNSPGSQTSLINFLASVSVPSPNQNTSTNPGDGDQISLRTGSYESATLKPGDILEIRVVETNQSDEPVWQESDPEWTLHNGPRAEPNPD